MASTAVSALCRSDSLTTSVDDVFTQMLRPEVSRALDADPFAQTVTVFGVVMSRAHARRVERETWCARRRNGVGRAQ